MRGKRGNVTYFPNFGPFLLGANFFCTLRAVDHPSPTLPNSPHPPLPPKIISECAPACSEDIFQLAFLFFLYLIIYRQTPAAIGLKVRVIIISRLKSRFQSIPWFRILKMDGS